MNFSESLIRGSTAILKIRNSFCIFIKNMIATHWIRRALFLCDK